MSFSLERSLERVSKKLGVEIIRLSWDGHHRVKNIDFWPSTNAFWNRSTDERGHYPFGGLLSFLRNNLEKDEELGGTR